MELQVLVGVLAWVTVHTLTTTLSVMLCAGAGLMLSPGYVLVIQAAGHVLRQCHPSLLSPLLLLCLRATEITYHLSYRLPKSLSPSAAISIGMCLALLPASPTPSLLSDLITSLIDSLLLTSLLQFAQFDCKVAVAIIPAFTGITVWTHMEVIGNMMKTRVVMLGLWIGMILIALPVIFGLKNRVKKTILRKFYHFLALLIFLPALNDQFFLSFAFISALTGFIFIEFLRKIPSLDFLNVYFSFFIDSRDHGEAALTHIFLLAGCGFPVVYEYYSGLQGLGHVGLMVLCVGDSLAAIVGSSIGTHKVPYGGEKTWEGVVAGATSMMVYASVCSGDVPLMVLTPLAAVYEAYTQEIDNFSLPLFGMTAYAILKSG